MHRKPSIPLTKALMAGSDLVIATGGRPMVRSAYSSGTPAFGSGAGNSTMIIDETADVAEAARNTRISKTSDFGSGCSCDGNLVIHEDVYDAMVKALENEGGYLATKAEAEALKKVMWDEQGHRLPLTVAISAQKLAEAAGFTIGDQYKFIMVDGENKIGREHSSPARSSRPCWPCFPTRATLKTR
jgi:sulfoacetaldehyde dehydrogenase